MSLVDILMNRVLSRIESDTAFLMNRGVVSPADYEAVVSICSRAGLKEFSLTNPGHHGETGRHPTRGLNLGARDVVGMPASYEAPPTVYSAPAPSTPLALYSPTPTPCHANNLAPFNTPAPAFPDDPPVAYGTLSPAPSNSALMLPVPPPLPAPNGPQCKALYDYNLDGRLEGDLTFRSGDLITIVREDDQDWWTGRLDGQEGMFPSDHVEKL